MRTELAAILTSKTTSSLFDVKQIGSALDEVIAIKEEVPVDVQVRKNNLILITCFFKTPGPGCSEDG